MTVFVDVESQTILAEDVRRSLGTVLREMFERGGVPPCDVLLAGPSYDCKKNEEIAIFKPIRREGCYKSPERIDSYLRCNLNV